MVPAETSFPVLLSTGMLSPESALSSTALFPSKTTPSKGMDIPGRRIKISPTDTEETGRVVSFSPSKITAVLGVKSIKPFRALVVFPLE